MNRLFTLLLAASCLTAVGQSEYCLDGTVWDATLGGCVVQASGCGFVSDLNGDGSVGSSDLLALLSEFGSEISDSDQDGVCDEVDNCPGELDECGVCEGPGAIYSCGCSECDDCTSPVVYQGVYYSTVRIGDQCWFAENLRSSKYANGDDIPSDLSFSNWVNSNSGAMTTYGSGDLSCISLTPELNSCDEELSLHLFGRLYNWYAVDDPRGLCPAGWHIPNVDEWTVLSDHLGGQAEADFKMRSNYGWDPGDPEFNQFGHYGNGTNTSGFTALPAGSFKYFGGITDFGGAGAAAVFWTSLEGSTESNAYMRSCSNGYTAVVSYSVEKECAFSIRCLKD